MSVEVYFSRPGQVSEIKDRIINDIKHAKKRLLVAQYTIDDDEVVNSLVSNTNVIEKKLILNEKNESFNNLKYVVLGCKGNPIYSNMHHKFLIIDDTVWVGSFNMTSAAAERNWENILRITDMNNVRKFVQEFKKMYMYARCIPAPDGSVDYAYLFSNTNNIHCNSGCSSEIEDIFTHFRPIYYTEFIERYYMIEDNDSKKNLKEKITLPLSLTRNILTCNNSIQSINGTCVSCNQLYPSKNMSLLDETKVSEEYVYGDPSRGRVSINRNSSNYQYCTECLYDYLEGLNLI